MLTPTSKTPPLLLLACLHDFDGHEAGDTRFRVRHGSGQEKKVGGSRSTGPAPGAVFAQGMARLASARMSKRLYTGLQRAVSVWCRIIIPFLLLSLVLFVLEAMAI